ncbi:MAG: DUF2804 domain-containing protein [Propionibacteriaceae bacterium]|jgi:hypothetical protein|nr:DUF2804 domain-containing protein [Propionibacteriaceae bacterium]
MIIADSVVENGKRHWGRFLRTPANANPVDEYTGVRRAFERFRTKEWAGFTLTHREFFSSMIIQDAKYLVSSDWYLFDAASGQLFQHAASKPAGSVSLPTNIMASRIVFEAKGYRISYTFGPKTAVVEIAIAASDNAPKVEGRLELDVEHAAPPLVVSAKLPKGSMYTNKIIFPASGTLRVGEREYVFDPSVDFAILDEHKSHLPYRTSWTWGTFALPVAGEYAGANFAVRPQLPDQQEESCIWTPQAAEPLADISFSPSSSDPMAEWKIKSADGRLDVVFTPLGRKGVNQQLVLAEVRYFQMFGTYRGRLRGESETWEFDGVHGVCEEMKMRS